MAVLELQTMLMGYGRLFLMDKIPWSVLGGMASPTVAESKKIARAVATAKLQGLIGAAIFENQQSLSLAVAVNKIPAQEPRYWN